MIINEGVNLSKKESFKTLVINWTDGDINLEVNHIEINVTMDLAIGLK